MSDNTTDDPFASLRGSTSVIALAEWSSGQEAALDAIDHWLKDPNAKQVFRLYGAAGTGKTTLARAIGERTGNVAYGTFTGKAADVLRKKGCTGADTLDALIYTRPAWWDCKKGCAKPPCRYPCEHARIHYGAKSTNSEGPLSNVDLIIVDEVSMVGEEMGRDLLSFGKKILVIGDPYQLPPIHGRGFFTRDEPDVLRPRSTAKLKAARSFRWRQSSVMAGGWVTALAARLR